VKLALGAVASLGYLTAALTAWADVGPAPFSRVALLLPACEEAGLGATELRNALALDLRDEGLSLAPAGELAPDTDVLVRLEAACAGASELTIHAAFKGDRRSRLVELAEVPERERGRALSLALAELLRLMGQTQEASTEPPASTEVAPGPAPRAALAVGPTITASPPEKAAPSEDSTTAPAPDEARDRRPEPPAKETRRWQVGLSPELRSFRTTTLLGGRAFIRYSRWSLGLDVLTANDAVPAGSVRTVTPHASVAYALPLWRLPGTALLEAGPRLGAGRTFMDVTAGDQARAGNAEDVYLDAAILARFALDWASSWRVGLAGELGYARGPIGYADDRVLARTSGLFASLLGEVAWRL
jgi:hypothetical protein